ncbi:MAG: endonuclease MutS2 [Clostridiales bacterium]|jgi:DNA mismatch repair protein MutS2|nr:endonuclease MutS2 [Clostridiales bacterium]
MNEKAMKILEYNKIIDLLASKAISPMGKNLCRGLLPVVSLQEITAAQKETAEAYSMLMRKGSFPIGGIKDISVPLKRVEMSGALNIEELLNIGEFLYVVKKALNFSKYDNQDDYFELVEKYFSSLQAVPQLEKEISRCIVNENELADDASNALYEIRKNIKISNSRIREQLNSVIHSANYKNMLQDTVITIRSGRYCVPIKQEYRNSFQGMVHDQSSTGATLFVEPISVVNLNNKIKELSAKEQDEINKILSRLSDLVFESLDVLKNDFELLAYLDFVFAKGQLAIDLKASEPKFNTEGYINIKKARHPLLSGTVVPIDIYLGKSFTMLLITGPNTGGKTVSLKTLGLFTLMGQSGLHIPAFDNSELNVFDEVFADIGDEQSIEQSLSTFSGHMTNIVNILKEVNYNSLVLLDELGAGTDPVEGAALAMSILQYLHARKIRCAVTTHYSELKVYALSTEAVENAACEFDVDTLRPTYRLLIGVPGKSNAFAISKRLGLDDMIIENAKQLLTSENVKFEDLITELEISKKTVEIEMGKAESYRRESERLKKDLESQKEKLQEQRQKQIFEAKEAAHRILYEAKEEADKIIRNMQKLEREKNSFKELDAERNKLKDKMSSVSEEVSKGQKSNLSLKRITSGLKMGDRVYVHSFGQNGQVVSVDNTKRESMVSFGNMKVKVSFDDLSIDETKATDDKKYNNLVTSVKKGKSQFIKPELDLRGKMVDEALEIVDKYLDDAFLAGLSQVIIIHGKGTGALRSAVQSFVKAHVHVKSFRLGAFGEGESGVTVCELK